MLVPRTTDENASSSSTRSNHIARIDKTAKSASRPFSLPAMLGAGLIRLLRRPTDAEGAKREKRRKKKKNTSISLSDVDDTTKRYNLLSPRLHHHHPSIQAKNRGSPRERDERDLDLPHVWVPPPAVGAPVPVPVLAPGGHPVGASPSPSPSPSFSPSPSPLAFSPPSELPVCMSETFTLGKGTKKLRQDEEEDLLRPAVLPFHTLGPSEWHVRSGSC